MCDSKCFCVRCNTKPVPEKLEDWAKIKAYREGSPASGMSDEYILTNWRSMASCIGALARRIQRDDTPPPPPVPQDVLIWREALARVYEADNCTVSRSFRAGVAEKYRAGVFDSNFHKEGSSYLLITLALQGFGKDGK